MFTPNLTVLKVAREECLGMRRISRRQVGVRFGEAELTESAEYHLKKEGGKEEVRQSYFMLKFDWPHKNDAKVMYSIILKERAGCE